MYSELYTQAVYDYNFNGYRQLYEDAFNVATFRWKAKASEVCDDIIFLSAELAKSKQGEDLEDRIIREASYRDVDVFRSPVAMEILSDKVSHMRTNDTDTERKRGKAALENILQRHAFLARKLSELPKIVKMFVRHHIGLHSAHLQLQHASHHALVALERTLESSLIDAASIYNTDYLPEGAVPFAESCFIMVSSLDNEEVRSAIKDLYRGCEIEVGELRINPMEIYPHGSGNVDFAIKLLQHMVEYG